jgi:hypothetical protein
MNGAHWERLGQTPRFFLKYSNISCSCIFDLEDTVGVSLENFFLRLGPSSAAIRTSSYSS